MTAVLRVLLRCLLAALAAAGTASVCLAAADAKLTLAQCNRVPAINWVIAEPVGRTVPEFLAALHTDPALAARFAGLTVTDGGNGALRIAFPELTDPALVIFTLSPMDVSGARWGLAEQPLCPAHIDPITTVIEYYNARLNHYFITDNAAEQVAIERGDVGPGWVRTGESFPALQALCASGAVASGLFPVYRFFGVPGVGPNSHFFTNSPIECLAVITKYPGWAFEASPFWVRSGFTVDSCVAPSQAVLRLYNNGQGGGPNHRYTINPAVIAAMVAQGWTLEGVAWCTP